MLVGFLLLDFLGQVTKVTLLYYTVASSPRPNAISALLFHLLSQNESIDLAGVSQ